MPKKVVADIDDIVQARTAWTELVQLMAQLGFSREEMYGVISQWCEQLVETEE